jgi:hypothetical protein
MQVAVIEPGNFIAGTSLYNADVVKAQSKKMWDGMVRITTKIDHSFVFQNLSGWLISAIFKCRLTKSATLMARNILTRRPNSCFPTLLQE